jgi:hypothetical protein
MSDTKSKESQSKIFSQEPVFEGSTKDIKTHFFYYGRGMQQKCLTSSKKFLNHVGSKFGESVKQSIEDNKLVVTEMVRPKRYVSKSQFEAEDWTTQEDWKSETTDYRKYVRQITSDLSKAYSILWGQCNLALQTIIQRNKEFIAMKAGANSGDVKELYSIIQRICHGYTHHQNCFMAAMESVYNFHLIKGDEYADVSSYLEAFEKRYDIVEKAGWCFASIELRDLYIKELEDKRMKDHPSYKRLVDWRATLATSSPDLVKITDGMETCNDKYKAYVFVKRAGFKYENFRIDLKNAFDGGTDKFPDDVVEASRRLDNWRPQYVPKTREDNREKALQFHQKGEDTEGEQHYEGGHNDTSEGSNDNRSDVTCFKCDRTGHITKFCKFDTKANGDALNNKEAVQKLYHKLADVNRAKWKIINDKKNVDDGTGSQHFMGSEVIASEELPEFEEAILEEEEHDGLSYLQDTMIIDLRGKNHVFNQTGSHKSMNLFDVLCDNQSTCDVIVNGAFVVNIRQSKMTLVLRTQAGECRISMIADLPGVGTVWYYPNGVANILSQHRMVVNSGWDVDYSSRTYKKSGDIRDLKYECVTSEGIKLVFAPNKEGLHILDCTKYFGVGKQGFVFGKTIIDNKTNDGLAMCHNVTGVPAATDLKDAIDTVEKSKQNFSKRDQNRADRVRRFQHVAAHPSDETIIYSAMTNGIKNSPITKRDVKMAYDMLGRSKYGIEGKTVRHQPDAVVTDSMPVPTTILDYYKDVTLSVDILYVNKVPFLVSISEHIHYGTIRAIESMKISVLEEEIKRIIQLYAVRGFNIKYIMVDIQFKAIKDRGLLDAIVNVVGKGEHAPAIERFIRVIKERCRCYFAMIPFDNLPRIMVIHLLMTVIFYINSFIWKKGVSPFLSPLTILEGVVLDYNLHFQVIFGEYAQTYEVTTNTMKRRTVGSIALGPTGNLQGGVRFYSLVTGRILQRDRKSYTPLKMPEDAILRVNSLTKKSVPGLQFGDRNNIIDANIDNDNDTTGVNDDDEDDITEEHPYDIRIVREEDDDAPPLQDPTPLNVHLEQLETDDGDDADITGVAPENAEDEVEPPDSDEEDTEETTRTRSGRVSRPHNRENEYPGIYYSNGEVPVGRCLKPYYMDENYEQHLANGDYYNDQYFVDNVTETSFQNDESPDRISLIKVKEEYQHFIDAITWMDVEQNDITAMMFAAKQMSIQEGMRKYKDEGRASAMKEIINLTDNDCFGETKYEELSQEAKDKALPILMFMVLKRNGSLKTRGCANGSVQRLYTNKEDVSSPTPDFYAFKFVAAVIAREGRDAASVDLPGFFLQTDQDELILLKVTGAVALLLVESDPSKWRKHLRKENGKWVIYVICKKAIYGTMNAALLAYKKLAKLFRLWGFKMNPYDACVWNKLVNGKQFTIVFHIDDLMLSHMNPNIVTLYIRKLQKEYGSLENLTVTRGRVHEYLGMTIDFRVKGEVRFSQYDFVKKLLNSLPESLNSGLKNTAAPEYLFKTTDSSNPLDHSRKELFHTITAKTLWLSQRTRTDVQLAVGFCCTRIQEPNEHDWKKLNHLMQYIRATRFMPLIIASDGLNTIIYIDGSHAVHSNCKGHSGLFLTQGKGAMINVSKKLGLVTNSSTETEIVATGERLPKCTWFRYFRIAQGEPIVEDLLMQDNKSSMLLEKNGQFSVGKGSKHIHIRYFFATDKIEKKELKLIYCPTEKMIADYSTKPLQGAKFVEFRDQMQGIRAEDYDDYKAQYIAVLKAYDLYENEDNLADL